MGSGVDSSERPVRIAREGQSGFQKVFATAKPAIREGIRIGSATRCDDDQRVNDKPDDKRRLIVPSGDHIDVVRDPPQEFHGDDCPNEGPRPLRSPEAISNAAPIANDSCQQRHAADGAIRRRRCLLLA